VKIQAGSVMFDSFSDGFHMKKLKITKKVNQHHECFVQFDFDRFSSDLELADKELKIFDDENKLIFSGKVYSSDIMYSRERGSKEVEIKGYSLTKDTDVVHNNRVFQSPQKKIGDILQSVNKKFTVKGKDDIEIVHPVVQYNETDFEFAVRMARENSLFVFVDDSAGCASLKLGESLDNTSTLFNIDKVYSISKVHQFDCKDGDMTFPAGIIVRTEQYVPFGATVQVSDSIMGTRINGKYVVFQMSCCREEQNAYFFEYVLYDKNFPVAEVPKYMDDLHIRARVVKNDDEQGRIQVKFSKYPDKKKGQEGDINTECYDVFEDVDGKDENTRTWMPYLTPYSQKDSGIVFMPNTNDAVEVIFSRNTFFAINSLRLEKIGEQFIEREQNKYIFHKDKYIAFRNQDNEKKGIEIFSQEKCSIHLNDKAKKITINIGKSTIEMDDSSIKMSNGSSHIEMTSKDIKISNGSSIISVDSGKIEVSSNKINLK